MHVHLRSLGGLLVGAVAILGAAVAWPASAQAAPNEIAVVVDGCAVTIEASSFEADVVDTVDWEISQSGSSGVVRSGVVVIGEDGAGSAAVTPQLSSGTYILTWSYPWHGNSARDGQATFTIPSCGSKPSPSATATATASTSAAPSAEPEPSATSTASPLPAGSASDSPELADAAGNGPGFGPDAFPEASPATAGSALSIWVVAALTVLALGSAGAAAYVFIGRGRSEPRHRRDEQEVGLGPNLRYGGPLRQDRNA